MQGMGIGQVRTRFVTLQDRLDFTNGRPSGFDYLRILLAVSVIAFHTAIVTTGPALEVSLWIGWARPLCLGIVPGFFALSGFLVAGSLERNTVTAFLTLRAVRIAPALFVEVVISALLIGPMMTTLPLREYFASPVFTVYFLNVTGDIHYNLPGVFQALPQKTVNLQLWTVPFELYCYITLTLLALLRFHVRPARFALAAIAVLLAAVAWQYVPGHSWHLDGRAPGQTLLIAFLVGVLLYLCRRRIPFSPWLCLGCAVTYALLAMHLHTIHLAAVPLAYIIVWVGLLNPPRSVLTAGADYSYGMYLYGYPIQQVVSEIFPQQRVWWFNLLASLPLCALCAYLSWTLVENPVLGRKKMFVQFATRVVRAVAARVPAHPVVAALRSAVRADLGN